jgi:phosphate transport system ATP-binding protein
MMENTNNSDSIEKIFLEEDTEKRAHKKNNSYMIDKNETTPFKIVSESLNFYYGDKQALIDINIEVLKNSVMALIGPSGCGKSTFLRCLNRMNDIIPNTRATGDIKLDGISIMGNNYDVIELRRRIGMVFQKSNPFPKSIFENIAYGLKINGIKDRYIIEKTVEDSLKKAGLWDEVKDRLHESAYRLSGGQQQRLCIARTIAIEPEVILMDEPASALDPISTQKIEELIQDLKTQYTIIIVTHNMQQAARVSDYTAFFFMGKLIEVDITEKIFTKPSMQMTENYIRGKFG